MRREVVLAAKRVCSFHLPLVPRPTTIRSQRHTAMEARTSLDRRFSGSLLRRSHDPRSPADDDPREGIRGASILYRTFDQTEDDVATGSLLGVA